MVTAFTGAVALALGGEHSCTIATGGSVHCWGYNYDGQLDNGTAGFYTHPQIVVGSPLVNIFTNGFEVQ